MLQLVNEKISGLQTVINTLSERVSDNGEMTVNLTEEDDSAVIALAIVGIVLGGIGTASAGAFCGWVLWKLLKKRRKAA